MGLPPQYISDTAQVENSLVTVGCEVYGKLDFSILFSNVTVEEGAKVEYSLVMPGAVIKKGATVRYAIVAENSVIEEDAVVGESPESVADIADWGITVVGENLTVGKAAAVSAKQMLTENVPAGGRV
jgi:glucose-1-phosphate adenylyltransferase